MNAFYKKNNFGGYFFLGLVLVSVVAISLSWYRIFVERDYIIEAQVSCDPEEEQCFLEACLEEDAECLAYSEEWQYKIIRKKAFDVIDCHPDRGDCPEMSCGDSLDECEEIFCDEDSLEEYEGVVCSQPDIAEEGDALDEYIEEDADEVSDGASMSEGDESALDEELSVPPIDLIE